MLRRARRYGVRVFPRVAIAIGAWSQLAARIVQNKRVVASLLVLGSGGCGQLAATWDQTNTAPVVEAYGRGDATLPDTGSAGAGEGGNESAPLPHPDGCGDRRGPATPAHDTIADCALPALADVEADGGTLPLAARGVPSLLLGDDALFVSAGSAQALLYDLYAKREKLSLTLAGGFVAPGAVADDERICLVLDVAGMSLQCFNRELAPAPWTLQLAAGTGTVTDMLLDGATLWIEYSLRGFGELLAVNLANGSVRWRHAPLDGSGRIVRIGPDIVGYEQTPCVELASPDVCLRAVDAASGETRATIAAQYQRFVWSSGNKALFTNSTDFFEYDASLGSFGNVTETLAPLVASLDMAELYAQGEPLADGRVLVVLKTPGAAALELAVVDPTSFAFKKLGVPSPRLLRVHQDVLIADGAFVPLTDDPMPAGVSSSWFGIFGFDDASNTYARKIR